MNKFSHLFFLLNIFLCFSARAAGDEVTLISFIKQNLERISKIDHSKQFADIDVIKDSIMDNIELFEKSAKKESDLTKLEKLKADVINKIKGQKRRVAAQSFIQRNFNNDESEIDKIKDIIKGHDKIANDIYNYEMEYAKAGNYKRKKNRIAQKRNAIVDQIQMIKKSNGIVVCIGSRSDSGIERMSSTIAQSNTARMEKIRKNQRKEYTQNIDSFIVTILNHLNPSADADLDIFFTNLLDLFFKEGTGINRRFLEIPQNISKNLIVQAVDESHNLSLTDPETGLEIKFHTPGSEHLFKAKNRNEETEESVNFIIELIITSLKNKSESKILRANIHVNWPGSERSSRSTVTKSQRLEPLEKKKLSGNDLVKGLLENKNYKEIINSNIRSLEQDLFF